MTKDVLKTVFEMCKDKKCDIAVSILVPGQDTPEIIINSYENLDNKYKFYMNAYDDNLVHVMNKDVKIVDINCIDFFSQYRKE